MEHNGHRSELSRMARKLRAGYDQKIDLILVYLFLFLINVIGLAFVVYLVVMLFVGGTDVFTAWSKTRQVTVHNATATNGAIAVAVALTQVVASVALIRRARYLREKSEEKGSNVDMTL